MRYVNENQAFLSYSPARTVINGKKIIYFAMILMPEAKPTQDLQAAASCAIVHYTR